MIDELDIVALLVDRPELKLAKGSVGTVVAAYAGGEAFEVEFVDPEGQTYGLETFRADELLKLHHRSEAA